MAPKAQRSAEEGLRRWALAAAGLTVLALLANVLLGAVNQDEGWYLYAAREVMAGRLPHRDFFFTQGLGFPVIYALFGWLWSAAGLLGGRLFTAALALGALLVADGAVVSGCRRADERWSARIVLWALLGVNLWWTYFTAIPKAYSLCVLLLAGALRLLTGERAGEGIDGWCAAGAGVLLAVAADVRLSMGVLLPVVTAWLWWRRAVVGGRAWRWFAGGGAVGVLLCFGPELVGWPGALLEAQHFHAAREAMGWVGRAGAVARWMRFNPLLVVLGLLLGWLWWKRRPALRQAVPLRGKLVELWLWCAVALGALHLLAPVPYDDYQVPTTLPLAMAVAFGFTLLPFDSLKVALTKVVLLAAVAITGLGSPMAEAWGVAGKDRLWVHFKAEPELLALRRAGAELRALAEARGEHTVWTQDTYLAVEAGLRVPEGLEMGPFSKPQPLNATPRLAAWSGYTFAFAFPELSPNPQCADQLAALKAAYPRPLRTFEALGQGLTRVTFAERDER